MSRIRRTAVLLAALALGAPTAALAQEFPALFHVIDVASDDVLNVRAAPSGSAEIVGSLAHDARWIEVVQREGNWGLVNVDERSGWAFMRFLDPVADGNLPEFPMFACYGTEPFWFLEVMQGQTAKLSTPDGVETVFTTGLMRAASGRFSPFALSSSTSDASMTLVAAPRECSDGMSDRTYGLEATVVTTGSEPLILSGCCTLESR